MSCKWCRKVDIKESELEEFRKDFNSNNTLRMCSGCRNGVKEAMK